MTAENESKISNTCSAYCGVTGAKKRERERDKNLLLAWDWAAHRKNLLLAWDWAAHRKNVMLA